VITAIILALLLNAVVGRLMINLVASERTNLWLLAAPDWFCYLLAVQTWPVWLLVDLVRWLKWWLWDSRRCEHEPGEWFMVDMGMGKARWCKKCHRCVDRI